MSLPELIKALSSPKVETAAPRRANAEALGSLTTAPAPLERPLTPVFHVPPTGRPHSSSVGSTANHRAKALAHKAPTFESSTISDDSDDDDESYYVQSVLPSQSYDHEHLREHLKTYDWDKHGREILANVILDRGTLKNPALFPAHQDSEDDSSYYSHYQVFDIGKDGAPLPVESHMNEHVVSKATAIWHTIKDINVNANRRQAVGRITIAREPSPLLFGALHLTMNKYFDVDEIFKIIVESDASSAHCRRSYKMESRKQRTFLFNFQYYTIVGEECKPMSWQLADIRPNAPDSHIPLTRCGSVVGLYLHGEPIRRVRNPARKAKSQYGLVHDPWAAWHVLNIQCFPDWKANTEVHDSSKHYLNGPEAFLHTLLHEFKDAQIRFDEIHRRISKIIVPPHDFIFDDQLRDKRLFEDRHFTYTRRYFWAMQTLGIMNESIKTMIDAFEDTFTDDVWEGRDKILWPLIEESPRNEYFKKRMRTLRLAFEREMAALRILIKENKDRQAEIRSLRDQLFSGTSVLESRKSVELAEITTQQGHNIKLLTLVNMFFLPLTFVTSVYGMTNMPTEHKFWMFGVTLACVCVPFFLLIGSLNTTSGLRFWKETLMKPFVFCKRLGKKRQVDISSNGKDGGPMERSRSTEQGMAIRMGTQPDPVGQ